MNRNKKRRSFTREFKAEAVRLVHSGRDETEVAREIGVRADTLRNWIGQAEGRAGMRADGTAAMNATHTEQEEGIRQLRREVEMLKEERDFLKKRRRTSRADVIAPMNRRSVGGVIACSYSTNPSRGWRVEEFPRG
jgi:transposase